MTRPAGCPRRVWFAVPRGDRPVFVEMVRAEAVMHWCMTQMQPRAAPSEAVSVEAGRTGNEPDYEGSDREDVPAEEER